MGKPYGLKLRLHGHEPHVEAKGTTVYGAARVVLTIGKVITHTGASDRPVRPRQDRVPAPGCRRYQLGEGTSRVWVDWRPAEAGLNPLSSPMTCPT